MRCIFLLFLGVVVVVVVAKTTTKEVNTETNKEEINRADLGIEKETEENETEIDDADYDNARIEQARYKPKKSKCERKRGFCKLPSRGWCKIGYSPANGRRLCEDKHQICCLPDRKNKPPKCGLSTICKSHSGVCQSKKEKCHGHIIKGDNICGSKHCVCCGEKQQACEPWRPVCTKCGVAPIEVASIADTGTRKVQAKSYALDGTVTDEGTRIINGNKASPLEYPFMAHIIANRSGNTDTFCGASIIARDWVLTAAHCLTPLNNDFTGLMVGIGNIFRDLLIYVPLIKVIIHPDYNPLKIQFGNDIALIQLAEPLPFERLDSVDSICLALDGDVVKGEDVVHTGWGLLMPNEPLAPNELFEVALTVAEVNVCSYFTEVPKETERVICTINVFTGNCQGDSGGPVVKQLCDGRWVQIGIASYGEDGCTQPRVHTNVAFHNKWIKDNIGITIIC